MNNENQNTEYKRIWKDEYLKWVSGFANAQGGKIYIGIDDDMTVVGVDNLHNIPPDLAIQRWRRFSTAQDSSRRGVVAMKR